MGAAVSAPPAFKKKPSHFFHIQEMSGLMDVNFGIRVSKTYSSSDAKQSDGHWRHSRALLLYGSGLSTTSDPEIPMLFYRSLDEEAPEAAVDFTSLILAPLAESYRSPSHKFCVTFKVLDGRSQLYGPPAVALSCSEGARLQEWVITILKLQARVRHLTEIVTPILLSFGVKPETGPTIAPRAAPPAPMPHRGPPPGPPPSSAPPPSTVPPPDSDLVYHGETSHLVHGSYGSYRPVRSSRSSYRGPPPNAPRAPMMPPPTSTGAPLPPPSAPPLAGVPPPSAPPFMPPPGSGSGAYAPPPSSSAGLYSVPPPRQQGNFYYTPPPAYSGMASKPPAYTPPPAYAPPPSSGVPEKREKDADELYEEAARAAGKITGKEKGSGSAPSTPSAPPPPSSLSGPSAPPPPTQEPSSIFPPNIPPTTAARDEASTCRICMENEINCTIVDCGHAGCCDKCLRQVLKCPFCKTPITKVIPLYRV
eukprot:TRINITY_DN28434_c0_g1_i1.p1 TRINITY_DN28434_c0_g1~~TRINITY_DN28434_c0_g1_i1.p1  ORF type:complete len:476 (+),score=119.37 TRINITY_DN28434_c0_g1_i1:171-1598(+)